MDKYWISRVALRLSEGNNSARQQQPRQEQVDMAQHQRASCSEALSDLNRNAGGGNQLCDLQGVLPPASSAVSLLRHHDHIAGAHLGR
jgi:hypothetical protein